MSATVNNNELHNYLCENYARTSHSHELVIGMIRHGVVYYGEFNMSAQIIADSTKLQMHKRGLRIRFNLTNGSFYRLCKRSHKGGMQVLCSEDALNKYREELITKYPNVKSSAFGNGIVFEYAYAKLNGLKWHYDAQELAYYLASDIDDKGRKIQCKLSNASISESSILNAIEYCAK